jgi:uncharacterized membrane protein SirB2
MDYALLKSVHVICAGLSVSGYIVRGIWMLRESPRLQAGWVKVAPHVIDTILLASAIALTFRIEQYPFVHGWLTAKVVALVAYIGLGTIGLKRGRTRTVRLTAWIAALATFGYIVAVALTRSPSLALA